MSQEGSKDISAAINNHLKVQEQINTEESGRQNMRATDAAKAIASDEMAEIRRLLAGNLVRRFKEIKEAKEKEKLEKTQVDEEAIGYMGKNDRNSRLHSIAIN